VPKAQQGLELTTAHCTTHQDLHFPLTPHKRVPISHPGSCNLAASPRGLGQRVGQERTLCSRVNKPWNLK
jgi:hypothetical protein